MTPEGWSAFPWAADAHGVTLQVEAVLRTDHGAPDEVIEQLRARAHAHRATHLRTLAALADLIPILTTTDSEWAVLKGPILSDHVYRTPGRRSYSDLDLLLPERQVPAFVSALEARGAVVATRKWDLIESARKAEIGLTLRQGIGLDLHWNILGSPGKAAGFRFDTAEVLNRTHSVEIGAASGMSLEIPTLDPCDQFLGLAVHAVRSGFGPLRYCLDIDQSWRHDPPDPDTLNDRALATGTALPAVVALHRTAAGLHEPPSRHSLPVPRSGRAWQHTMAGWDRANPPSAGHERPASSLIASATRESTSESVRALIGLADERRETLLSPRKLLNRMIHGPRPPEPEPLLLDIDNGSRDRFLTSLERGTWDPYR